MASVYRPAGSRKYRIAYVDAAGRRRTVKGFHDKQATEALARRLERDAERARAGLVVPTAAPPAIEAISAYIADLRRQGASDVHTEAIRYSLYAISNDLVWQRLDQIRPDRFRAYLADLQQRGRSRRTLNHYLQRWKAFCTFAVAQGWVAENPLAGIKPTRKTGDGPNRRRAFTLEEFRALLAVATNPRHHAAYMLAGLAGFRRAEIARLERRDVDAASTPPLWRLRPEVSKVRRAHVIPILPELRPLIARLCVEAGSATGRLAPPLPSNQTMAKHLKKAGIAKRDDQGRVVNFHALRYFFCTQLARKLPIQIVKLYMRHASISRTCDLYTDLGLDTLTEAVKEIPRILGEYSAPTSAHSPPRPEPNPLPPRHKEEHA